MIISVVILEADILALLFLMLILIIYDLKLVALSEILLL